VAPDLASKGSIWVVPHGDPALTLLESTGRRYRGIFEIRHAPTGGLLALNHVGLETYVAGIAEEKGQGWPHEGLKALAIAARTLGAATMTWYGKHHADGYDICPSANCQVYLGYDGEEPAMARATAATAGVIRTYRGSPILAMYHGNGGGQTESYARMAGRAEDTHPYLRSIKYPYADPSRWREETSMAEIAAKLSADPDVAATVSIPRPLQGIEIVETGETPRVAKLRLEGGGRHDTMSGQAFARALGLPSTWFGFSEASSATLAASAISRSAGTVTTSGTTPSRSWPLAYVALVLATLAVAATALGVVGPSVWGRLLGPLGRLQSAAGRVFVFVPRRRKGV
jgi:SpoIID/LytB domain protein